MDATGTNGFVARYNNNGSMVEKQELRANNFGDQKHYVYDAYERLVSVLNNGYRILTCSPKNWTSAKVSI
jgi:hypothetical protein